MYRVYQEEYVRVNQGGYVRGGIPRGVERGNEARPKGILWEKLGITRRVLRASLGEAGHNEARLRAILWEKPGHNEAHSAPWVCRRPTTRVYMPPCHAL